MKIRNRKKKLNYLPKNNSIKCTCCGNYYKLWEYGNAQALDCASYFSKDKYDVWHIYSSYGSGYDTCKFDIINQDIIQPRHVIALNSRVLNQDNPYDYSKIVVCDRCIKSFLEKNYIIQDENYDAFAGISEMNAFYNEYPERYMELFSESGTDIISAIRAEREKMEEALEEL